MGLLTHGPVQVEMDDEVLAHLEAVIVYKFRHWESFVLTWVDETENAHGRRSLWLAHRAATFFEYENGDLQALDRQWLQRLHITASSSRGLVLVYADGRPAQVRVRRHAA